MSKHKKTKFNKWDVMMVFIVLVSGVVMFITTSSLDRTHIFLNDIAGTVFLASIIAVISKIIIERALR